MIDPRDTARKLTQLSKLAASEACHLSSVFKPLSAQQRAPTSPPHPHLPPLLPASPSPASAFHPKLSTSPEPTTTHTACWAARGVNSAPGAAGGNLLPSHRSAAQVLLEKAPQGPGSGVHSTGFSCENHLQDQPQRRDLALGTRDGKVLPVLPSHPAAGGLKVPSLVPPFFLDSKPHVASFPVQGLGGPRIQVCQLVWLLLVLITGHRPGCFPPHPACSCPAPRNQQ